MTLIETGLPTPQLTDEQRLARYRGRHTITALATPSRLGRDYDRLVCTHCQIPVYPLRDGSFRHDGRVIMEIARQYPAAGTRA